MGRRRVESRGERNVRWIQDFCLVPSGPNKGLPVKLTPDQREIVSHIYDRPGGPHCDGPVTAPLSAYLALLHLCGFEGRVHDFQPDVNVDSFTLWAAVSPELRRVLKQEGATIVCPGLGTRYSPSPEAA